MSTALQCEGISLNGAQHNGRGDRATLREERYDFLAMRIVGMRNKKEFQPVTVGVLGVETGVGASTVAFHLAESMSHLSAGVLLIDADIEKNSTSQTFRLGNQLGLVQVLSDECELDQGLHETHVPTLQVLPSGGQNQPRGSASLVPSQLRDLLSQLNRQFYVIIVDLPSATNGWTGIRLSSVVDDVLLVVESERSNIATTKRITGQLAAVKANLIGVVLNKQRQHVPRWFQRKN